MSRRLARTSALVLATIAAALAAALPAGATLLSDGGGTTLLSPDDAAAAISAVPDVASGSTTLLVDGSAVVGAASSSGSDTSLEPGLTLDEAVGLVPLGSSAGLDSLARRAVCWANAAWHQWGTWPYQQRITDTTYWCAIYGSHITFRSSSVTTSGTLCGTGWRESQLIGGGVGFPSMTIRSSAGYACPTVIPWVTLHPSRHEDVYRDDRGRAAIVGSG